MPMILLMYKNTYFNTNNLDHYISSVCVFVFHDFKDIFVDEIPGEFFYSFSHPHMVDLFLWLHFLLSISIDLHTLI